MTGVVASSERPMRRRLPAPRRPQRRSRSGRRSAAGPRPRARGPRRSRDRRPTAAPCSGGAASWPSTSRSRGAGSPRPPGVRARPASEPQRRDGLDSARTAVAVPSPRLRRSSPRRAWSGPRAPPSSRWTNPRTSRTASSNASHGLRSRHSSAAGSLTWPPTIRSGAVRPGPSVRRLAGRIACRKASRSAASDRRGPQVALDPVDDRGQADQLARRVQGEELVDQVLGAVDGREPAAQARADRVDADVGVEPDEVLLVERRLALLAAAALVAADRAAVVPGDRSRLGAPRSRARPPGRRPTRSRR